MKAQGPSAVSCHGFERHIEKTVYYFWSFGAKLTSVPNVWDKEVCVCGFCLYMSMWTDICLKLMLWGYFYSPCNLRFEGYNSGIKVGLVLVI